MNKLGAFTALALMAVSLSGCGGAGGGGSDCKFSHKEMFAGKTGNVTVKSISTDCCDWLKSNFQSIPIFDSWGQPPFACDDYKDAPTEFSFGGEACSGGVPCVAGGGQSVKCSNNKFYGNLPEACCQQLENCEHPTACAAVEKFCQSGPLVNFPCGM